MVIISLILQILGVAGFAFTFSKECHEEAKYSVLLQSFAYWAIGYLLWIYY